VSAKETKQGVLSEFSDIKVYGIKYVNTNNTYCLYANITQTSLKRFTRWRL